MPRFVKVINERDKSVMEIAVTAVNERAAEERGRIYLLSRFPTRAGKIEEIDAVKFGKKAPGIHDYRVMVTFNSGDIV